MAGFDGAGFYRIMIGSLEVTAILDGVTGINPGLMQNTSPEEIQKLSGGALDGKSPVKTSVNAFLVNTGAKLILIDAGGGNLCGPACGNLIRNIKASGYTPDQIDAVLLTHMHRDHIGGLLDAEGKPAFPSAVVFVSKPESDHWLPEEAEAKAPEDQKPRFRAARKTAETLAAAGKWRTFTGGEELFPGVKAALIPGHTPGHTAFEIKSAGAELVFTGDMIHCAAAQFPKPDISLKFDTDPAKAVSARKELLKKIADGKTLSAGAHTPFPGIGRIKPGADGSYIWFPAERCPGP
jgi:glyoxylase-like metal-dependent hydrolase (beta-lactamase superfamily II)